MTPFRHRSRRFKLLLIGVPVLIVIIVAIVVPIAVILPSRNRSSGPGSTSDTKIILPLYIYPNSTSWTPIYDALAARPDVHFTIIVNPGNGPGNESLPNSDYAPQIQRLNSYSNVETVGYVRTNYSTRAISEVLQDIATYSDWSSSTSLNNKKSNILMHGIFFDETPTVHSTATEAYMSTIDRAVKNATGLQGARTVIHNPGAIPDPGLTTSNTDITVVFEQTYAQYRLLERNLTILAETTQPRSHNAYMIHSTPVSTINIGDLVGVSSRYAQYLFITDLSEDYYQRWGNTWKEFVNVIPQ